MNWREHLRIVAIIVNVLFAFALVVTRAWFMSVGFGIPIIVPPVVAIVGLSVNRVTPRDSAKVLSKT